MDALSYLVHVRGLNRTTLRKYGVGKAMYSFPGPEQGYVQAECITFPWILQESEWEGQQDVLRSGGGATSPASGSSSSKKSLPLKSVYAPPTTTTTKKTKAPVATDSTSDKTMQEGDEPTGATTTTTTTTKEENFVTTRIKVRAVSQKGWQKLDPPGGGWGLFGLHTVPSEATEVIITEGEYDAMAVHQATGRPCISLPNGCRSLPPAVLPLLERFSKIILWMDNDAPGQEGAQTFCKKLGLNRCFVVKCLEAKDANEALLKGLDLTPYLDEASVLPHERLLTFADLRSEVLHEILEPDLYKGAAIPSLPTFTNLIKGFRRGEMTVLTGPTGSGKVGCYKSN